MTGDKLNRVTISDAHQVIAFPNISPLLFWLVVTLFFLSAFLSAENGKIKFQRLSLDDGLSQSIVECIIQDRMGYMWFGTEDGLNKYDGYRFTVYRQGGRNEIGLSHNNILSLYESLDGVLWIGAFQSGLHAYNPKTGETAHFTFENGQGKGLSNNLVRDIVEDGDGNLWLATQDGLNRLRREKDATSFTVYRHEPGNPLSIGDNIINCLLADRDGSLWVGTPSGLFHMRRDQKGFRQYAHDPFRSGSISDNNIQRLYRDKAGILWAGSENGLNRMDPHSGDFTVYRRDPSRPDTLGDNNITVIYEDSALSLWIGTKSGGLHILNRQTGSFSRFVSGDNPTSLSHNGIRSIREDGSGVVWIGSYGGGISKFARQKIQFAHTWAEPEIPCKLSHNIVWSVCEDRLGDLWIGSHGGGLNRRDRRTGCFRQYRHNASNPRSISSDFIRVVYEDSDGTIWVGTERDGLCRYNEKSDDFDIYRADPNNPSAIGSNSVLYICRDRTGILWVGSAGGGLSAMDVSRGVFACYLADAEKTGVLSNNFIRIIYEDRSGELWIGTQGGGLNRFHRKTQKFSHFRHNPADPQSLSNDYVFSLLEDRRGNFWVGAWGGGLNHYDRASGKFTRYSVADGLPSDAIYGVLEDEKTGALWLSTNNGLSRVSIDEGNHPSFKNFSEENGLQSREFNGGAYFKSKRTGEMFFGGINGFNSFFPSEITENKHIPPIAITAFYKMNKEIQLDKPLQEIKEIELSHRDYYFSFEFAALDYTAPLNNQYRYKMEGVDPEWIVTGAERRFASYTTLKPGKYLFRVTGANNDGHWNNTGAAIRIIIRPSFWQTWIFKILLSLILIALIITAHRRRTRNIRAILEKKRLENELNLKADFTAMLVHDLRSPLTAIMGYAEILKKKPDHASPEKIGHVITRSSGKMMELINDMLDYSKFEAGKMQLYLRSINFPTLIREGVELMRPLFEEKNMTLTSVIEPEAKSIRLKLDDNRIGQVLTNLLSNAVKYAPRGGTTTLRLHLPEPGIMELSVTDNGPGVSKELQGFLFDKYTRLTHDQQIKGAGLGLAVSRMIVEAHGGCIGYRPGPQDAGSCFYFRLPCHADAEPAPTAERSAGEPAETVN